MAGRITRIYNDMNLKAIKEEAQHYVLYFSNKGEELIANADKSIKGFLDRYNGKRPLKVTLDNHYKISNLEKV